MEPVLKWAGGKRKILTDIHKIIDIDTINGHKFYEPFVGGGAVSFSLAYKNTIINDFNAELVNVYNTIKENPEALIRKLREHENNHNHDYYYKIRNFDRSVEYKNLSNVDKAARIIYLNKTCYNGLYRVNRKGFFNVPIGKSSSKTSIVNEERINQLHNYLFNNNIEIRNTDFEEAVSDAKSGDIIYFDPPYDYEKNGFTSYVSSGFNLDDLKRLKEVCDKLRKKGCKVIISNNDTKNVRDIFGNEYSYQTLKVKRYISCVSNNRLYANEVIIYGK